MGGIEIVLVGKTVAVCVGICVCVEASERVLVGKINCKVGGICIGVTTEGGDDDSASASEIPPMTKMIEIRAMMTPPPS